MADLELIKDCVKERPRAMRMLYEQYKTFWFMLCLRYAENRADAEDILQQGLMLLFRDLHQFKPGLGTFKQWSSRVFINAALQYLRKEKKHRFKNDLEDYSNQLSYDANIIENYSAYEITRLLQKLPTGYRAVFNMYVIEGYTHKEIAIKLGISEGTSKSQLFKAKNLIRELIEVYFDG